LQTCDQYSPTNAPFYPTSSFRRQSPVRQSSVALNHPEHDMTKRHSAVSYSKVDPSMDWCAHGCSRTHLLQLLLHNCQHGVSISVTVMKPVSRSAITSEPQRIFSNARRIMGIATFSWLQPFAILSLLLSTTMIYVVLRSATNLNYVLPRTRIKFGESFLFSAHCWPHFLAQVIVVLIVLTLYRFSSSQTFFSTCENR